MDTFIFNNSIFGTRCLQRREIVQRSLALGVTPVVDTAEFTAGGHFLLRRDMRESCENLFLQVIDVLSSLSKRSVHHKE